MKQQRIGIVGIGKISGIYLQNLHGMFKSRIAVSAVADLAAERAEKAAKEYGIPHVCTVDELVHRDDVDIVLNLTVPQSHYEVGLKALEAKKHYYTEKPLCVTREEAAALFAAAEKNAVRLGSAPDTFLGAGLQTCRKIIDEGWIGKPVAATAFMMNHGPEHWHPAPEFYYKAGGGPLFDMGPYYLTALVSLLGPVTRLSGSAQKLSAARTITSEPLNGAVITVDVPTHIAATLDFSSGAVATLITSFDVWSHSLPRIEIYGTEGTLNVPDPNFFGGPVLMRRFREETWHDMPLINQYSENCRGLGLVDMAEAVAAGIPHQASGELAGHVLEIMHGIQDASALGTYYVLKGFYR
jgi:predicted dehydrogenase